jgi:hypothetical protein
MSPVIGTPPAPVTVAVTDEVPPAGIDAGTAATVVLYWAAGDVGGVGDVVDDVKYPKASITRSTGEPEFRLYTCAELSACVKFATGPELAGQLTSEAVGAVATPVGKTVM